MSARMFAATVDAVIFLPVVFGAGGYAVHVVTSRRRRAGRSAEDGDEFQQWFSTPQVAWGFRVFGLVSEVAMRNGRSPGGAAVKQLTRAATKDQSARMKAIEPKLRDIQRAHAGDPEAAQQATMKLYRDHRINPLNSCGWTLAHVIVMTAPVLFSERKQTLPDRIARIITVEV